MIIEFKYEDIKSEHVSSLLINGDKVVSINNQHIKERDTWFITIDLVTNVSYRLITGTPTIGNDLIKAYADKDDNFFIDMTEVEVLDEEDEEYKYDIAQIDIIRRLNSEEEETEYTMLYPIYPTEMKRI